MNRIRQVQIGALLTLTSSMAFANVSNELIIGLGSDSSNDVTVNTVNKIIPALSSSTDLSSKVEEESSLITFSYSYFLSPITVDDTAIDLRKFYQHPSQFNVGFVSIDTTYEDRSNPASTLNMDTSVGALMLGGEYYLPSNTGFLVGLGNGSGTLSMSAGASYAKADVSLAMIELGIRQYASKNVAFHLLLSSEETSGDLSGDVQDSVKETKGVTKIGVQTVFDNRVGLVFEIGRGKRESSSTSTVVAGVPDKYDVAEVKTELAFYGGKQFSVLLGVELNGQFQTGMPAGNGHEITGSRVRLAPRYWYSEKLGVELELYSVAEEELEVTPFTDTTMTTKSSGVQFRLGYRF